MGEDSTFPICNLIRIVNTVTLNFSHMSKKGFEQSLVSYLPPAGTETLHAYRRTKL